MDNNEDFNTTVVNAVENKTAWFDSTVLPKIQEGYRNHLMFIRNLFDILQKRSLIIPDPYKHDKKISAVACPSDAPFNENERPSQLGLRLSDYESMLDFICNYMKFSVTQLPTDKIKKLLEFNNTFNWANLSINSSRVNTKALGMTLAELKGGGGNVSVNMLFEGIVQTNENLQEINKNLKELGNFQRERYKGDIRKNIIASDKFNKSVMTNPAAFQEEIKRLFSSCLPRRPIVNDLIEEIINEETAPNKAELQQKLLAGLQVSEDAKTKKTNMVDTHEMIMAAVRSLGSLADQYNSVLNKVVANHDILAAENNTFKQKFARFIRRLFGIDDPPVVYEVPVVDKTTKAQRIEKVQYNQFTSNLTKRIKYYNTLTSKSNPNYQNLNAQKDAALFDLVSKHITENGRLQVLLAALDDYFKNSTSGSNRMKIKGIKMELTTLKNILVKANQDKSDYAAYVEEAEQMKKLGIDT